MYKININLWLVPNYYLKIFYCYDILIMKFEVNFIFDMVIHCSFENLVFRARPYVGRL